MAIKLRACAVLLALFSFASVMAQEGRGTAAGIDARIAAAKLAEVRGDDVAAEGELRAALAEAKEEPAKEKATLALQKLLLRLGRSEEAAALRHAATAQVAEPVGDPIARKIAMLDSGTAAADVVRNAISDLAWLGPLAVPPLLEALPKLGPFGVQNAFGLLSKIDDVRIAPALQKFIDASDPVVAVTIAQQLTAACRAVAVPLAKLLAVPSQPPAVQVGALAALIEFEPSEPATRTLALRLAADARDSVQIAVLDAVAKAKQPWCVEVWQVLRTSANPVVKVNATWGWLREQKDPTEAQVLAVFEELAPEDAVKMAVEQLREHRSWVQLGIRMLRAVRQGAGDIGNHGELRDVEWWRDADESVPEILAVAKMPGSSAGQWWSALVAVFEHGWQMPPDLDLPMAEFVAAHGETAAFQRLAEWVPADAEARAIAIWNALPPGQRWAFVDGAVRVERPWHRLVTAYLLTAKSAKEVSVAMLSRDWHGAPADVAAMLAQLAQRWPEELGNRHDWQQALIAAFTNCESLPASVILPFVVIGNESAWRALVHREPQTAFAHAKTLDAIPSYFATDLAIALQEHGGPAELSLALKCLPMLDDLDRDVVPHALADYLDRVAVGAPQVIALGCVLPPFRLRSDFLLQRALKAAAGARNEDLDALLEMLPRLDTRVVNELWRALLPQMRQQHAAILERRAEALLAAPLTISTGMDQLCGSADLFLKVFQLLAATGQPARLSMAKKLLALRHVPESVVREVVNTAVAAAGDGRKDLVLQMLAAESPAVVAAALLAPGVSPDEELRQRRREAMLRIADGLPDASDAFDAFPDSDRLVLAEQLLGRPTFGQLGQALAMSVVRTIGHQKDPARIPLILHALTHANPFVRGIAAEALGNTFSRDAAPHLIDLLKDDEVTVRQSAQHALDQIANYLGEKAKWEAKLNKIGK